MSPKNGSNVLPPKEQNLFKSVVRFYETKQLKKAIKSADTILKKYPDHGETLAMKGLTLNALDKKADATELVRRGLRMDMKSHICWHVYGLLYRSDRDYREAAKAYLNALRIDKDNQQILRDLALLQIQIRDYDGLEDTRRKLLTVRPNQRNNWIGFALSFHLLGNFATAVSVLDTYQDTLKDSNEPEDRYELSELMLYKNLILEESGDFEAALTHLDQSASKLVDRLAVRETRARLLSALGRYDEAAQQLRALLAINPDNHIYVRGLQACAIRSAHPDRALNGSSSQTDSAPPIPAQQSTLGSKKIDDLHRRVLGYMPSVQTNEEVTIALGICDELTIEYPFSRTALRIALQVLPSGDHAHFVPRVDVYVRKFLRKGIPSLFADIKPLYVHKSKANAMGRLFESYRNALEDPELGRLPNLVTLPDGEEAKFLIDGDDGNVEEEPSCTLLWVLHFLAQHYDRTGKRDLALETIQAAIKHSPDTIECYLVKARILKHYGDLRGAVEVADTARNLDLADRYLNTKCSKYGLRADMVTEAETWVGLFTRDGDSGGVQALYDMQCMWFELGAAESHLRRGQLAPALKKFTAVERHFADMVEDQFDFHSYCLRKVTLRAYVNLLRFEDHIRGHPYYARAAGGLVRCLLRLADLPQRERVLITGEHADIEGFADMTDSERKKAVSKRKKQLARQRQGQHGSSGGKSGGRPAANGLDKSQAASTDSSKAQNAGSSNENKPKSNPGWMESDPNGIKYIKEMFDKGKSGDPILEEATKIVRELERHLADEIDTNVLSFDLSLRKKKYLQALRAVRRAQRIDKDHPDTLLISVRLAHELRENGVRSSFSEVVQAVYEAEGDILGGKSTVEYVGEYCEKHVRNGERRVGASIAMLWLSRAKVQNAGSVEDACTALCKAIEVSDCEGIDENVISVAFCRKIVDDLRCEGLSEQLVRKVASICRKKYPKADCF